MATGLRVSTAFIPLLPRRACGAGGGLRQRKERSPWLGEAAGKGSTTNEAETWGQGDRAEGKSGGAPALGWE